MKGHFSIEWLSQSSQDAPATEPQGPALSRRAAELAAPGTASTPPETLPGLYCSRGQNGAGPQDRQGDQDRPEDQRQAHPHSTPAARHPEPSFGNPANLSSNNQATEAGFSSTEEEETSGYESEGGRSLSPAAPQDAPAAGRRPRTAFTVEQINRLERAFKRSAYLGTHDKAELCKKLSLSDKQIRNWFQNRRMKLKRTLQDTLAQACQANISSQLMHYPQLQAFGPTPHPGYYPAQESPSPYATPLSLHYIPSPVGGPTINTDSLYHQYSSLNSLFTATGSGPLIPHHRAYPSHY
ncbi:hypothetical protein AAFF_G00178370 [Aldrovandia affinis]|uniref:Homeobox domain-containing protein n=1 Tax=Aldrovandia affinis TaxID=143900 RepID=A0AAD7RND0_9TELE|nr:hypothetical protein AAFF_G00178370 [Aldrovandia affinis]